MKGDLPGVGGEWRRRAKDVGVEKESEGWGRGDDSETNAWRKLNGDQCRC